MATVEFDQNDVDIDDIDNSVHVGDMDPNQMCWSVDDAGNLYETTVGEVFAREQEDQHVA